MEIFFIRALQLILCFICSVSIDSSIIPEIFT